MVRELSCEGKILKLRLTGFQFAREDRRAPLTRASADRRKHE
jgi:hypothetical protein